MLSYDTRSDDSKSEVLIVTIISRKELQTDFFFPGFAFSNVLNLNLPKYAIDGGNIWVKCSSDIVPYEQIAEFLVNGVTADIIRRHKNSCFSSITRKVCSSDICNCSTDGKSYSTNLFTNKQIGNVTITCAMRLKRNEEVFKTDYVYISILGECRCPYQLPIHIKKKTVIIYTRMN